MKWILLALVVVNVCVAVIQFLVSGPDVENAPKQELVEFNNLLLNESQQQRLTLASGDSSSRKSKTVSVEECVRITGVSDGDLPAVESRLKAIEVAYQKEKINHIVKTDYQVLLGPFDEIGVARAKQDEVKAKGIDSYVITSGDYSNALSLGVFSSNENANKRIGELTGLGYSASVVKKDHFYEDTQLEIPSKSALLIEDATLSSILSSLERVDFLRYPCK